MYMYIIYIQQECTICIYGKKKHSDIPRWSKAEAPFHQPGINI